MKNLQQSRNGLIVGCVSKFFATVKGVKSVIILGLMLLIVSGVKATTYYSQNAGNPNTVGNWNSNIAGGGSTPGNFTTNGDIFIIQSGTTMVTNANWTIGSGVSGNVVTLQINGNLSINRNNNAVTISSYSVVIFNSTNTVLMAGAGSGNTFTLSAKATMKTINTYGITGANCSLPVAASKVIITLNAAANYEFNGTSAQAALGLPTTLANLTINNAAGVTFAVIHTISNITIGSVIPNSILSDGGAQITCTGTLTLTSGTFKLGGAAATTWPAFGTRNISSGTTVEYASAVAQTVSATLAYQNLTFSGAGQKNVAGTLSVAGNWSTTGGLASMTTSTATVTGNVAGSGAITFTSGTLTLGGNWTNNGTFTKGTGTVTYNGASPQTVGAVSYNNLTFSGVGEKTSSGTLSATTLAVSPVAKFTRSSGTMTVTTLNLNSDATGTGTFVDNGTSTITTANVQQYLAAGRDWYVSSPVAAAPVGALSTATTVISYNEQTAAWDTQSGSLTPLKGYVSASTLSTGPITFNGTLNNGPQSTSLPRHTGVAKEGFNLVGNPYPSYVDIQGATRTNLLTSYWYRTRNSGNTAYTFDSYNITSGLGTANSGLSLTKNIPPMQAFWVRVATNAGGTLGFTNSNRVHKDVSTNNFRAPSASKVTQQVLRLQVSNGVNSDETVIAFNPNASNSYDNYDSQKQSNESASVPEIYTMDGTEQLVINGLNTLTPDEELVLGFTPGQSSTFTIKASEISNFDTGTRIFLKDKLLNTEQELTIGSDYSFTSDATPTNTRMTLIFRTTSGSTGLNNVNNQNLLVYKNANNQITVNCIGDLNNESSVSVYNAVGQKLLAKQMTSNVTVLDSPLTSGVYMVTVTNAGKSVTKKVILN